MTVTAHRLCRAIVVAAFCACSAACTHAVGYRPDYLTTPTNVSRIPGSAAIIMSPAVVEATTDTRPSAHTAPMKGVSADQLVQKIAVSVFGATMQGGAIGVPGVTGRPGKTYTIEPTLIAVSYKYDQLSNLGLAVTPRASVTIRVRIRDAAGELILDQMYHRNRARGTYFVSFDPQERMNRALHQAIELTMVDAAQNFAAVLRAQAPRTAAS